MSQKDSRITFSADVDGVRLMAVFIAQLEKECVTYKIENWNDNYFVTLTGGF